MKISTEIKKRLGRGAELIDIICDLVESSEDFDYADVAEVVKADPTMLATLKSEFEKRNMMKSVYVDELNLTDFFDNMGESC